MTHFSSENRTGHEIMEETTSHPALVSINNITYQIEVYFYKEGEPESEWRFLKPEYINRIVFNETLFTTFPSVILSYGGMEFRDPIQFEGNKKDRVYIFLSRAKQKDVRSGDMPQIPYPAIDCEFVIWSMSRSPNDNVHSQSQLSTTTLTLMPTVQFELETTYPQWTTGFDTRLTSTTMKWLKLIGSGFGSGKKTGVCIEEILQKCNCEVDRGSDLFDNGIATINYTIPLRQSALEAIRYILKYHTSEKNNDVCVFKYNQFSKKFILPPLSKLFKFDLKTDEIKTFPSIPIRSEQMDRKKAEPNTTYRITSPVVSNIQHKIETIGTELKQTINTSRRQGTFVMDSRECDADSYEFYMKDHYLDGELAGEQDLDTLVAPYQRIATDVMMTPHYRKNERISMSPQLINKIKTANTFSFDIPGTGGTWFVGRRFCVRTSYGAAKGNEKLKEMLGAYLITEVTHDICPRDQVYTTSVVGQSLFQAKDDEFAFAVNDQETKEMAEDPPKV